MARRHEQIRVQARPLILWDSLLSRLFYLLSAELVVHLYSLHLFDTVQEPLVILTELSDVVTRLRQDAPFTLGEGERSSLRHLAVWTTGRVANAFATAIEDPNKIPILMRTHTHPYLNECKHPPAPTQLTPIKNIIFPKLNIASIQGRTGNMSSLL